MVTLFAVQHDTLNFESDSLAFEIGRVLGYCSKLNPLIQVQHSSSDFLWDACVLRGSQPDLVEVMSEIEKNFILLLLKFKV